MLHGMIDCYRVRESIGGGRYSEVFRITDKVHCDFALKSYKSDFATKSKLPRVFVAETEALRGLDHQNVVKLIRSIHADPHLYNVLELVDGRTMAQYVPEGVRMTEVEARHIFRQIFCAFQYLHGQNRIHGDVTADNIMLTGGSGPDRLVKVIDFGQALVVEPAQPTEEDDLAAGGHKRRKRKRKPLVIETFARGKTKTGDIKRCGLLLARAVTGSTDLIFKVGEVAV